jgi:hypothetical protein
MGWLVAQFGAEALAEPVVTPTDDFFPGIYEGAAEDVRRVVAIVGARLGAEPNSYDIEFGDVDPSLIDSPYWSGATAGTAGEYRSRDGRGVISISMRQAATPMALVATVAHEFGHHRLLGERRIDPARRDQEPLTDLATVFFGFGIFTANASREFDVVRRVNAGGAPVTGWRSMRLGYLTEPMFGYAPPPPALRAGLWGREAISAKEEAGSRSVLFRFVRN